MLAWEVIEHLIALHKSVVAPTRDGRLSLCDDDGRLRMACEMWCWYCGITARRHVTPRSEVIRSMLSGCGKIMLPLLMDSVPIGQPVLQRLCMTWIRELLRFVEQRRAALVCNQVSDWRRVFAHELSALVWPFGTDEVIRHLSNLVFDAVLLTTPPDGRFMRSRIQVRSTDVGREPCVESKVISGLLIDFQPSTEAQHLLRRSERFAGPCLVVSESLRACCHGATLRDAVARLRLKVLLCQRTVDEELRFELAAEDVLVIERLSIRYIALVSELLQTPASSLDAAMRHHLPNMRLPNISVEATAALKRHQILLRRSEAEGDVPAYEGVVTINVNVPTASIADSVETLIHLAIAIAPHLIRGEALCSASQLASVLPGYIAARCAFEGVSCWLPDAVYISPPVYALTAAVLQRGPAGCDPPEGVSCSAFAVDAFSVCREALHILSSDLTNCPTSRAGIVTVTELLEMSSQFDDAISVFQRLLVAS